MTTTSKRRSSGGDNSGGGGFRVNPDWARLPIFDRKGWKTVLFGDVVQNLNETCAPKAAGVERYIGLEHLEPGSLHVRTWGNVADGTTFNRRCRPGQVLFGKRRAYQRKVAVAEFDAVVSGDIYVLAPKGDRFLPELLPFICLSERFFQHAVGTSAGSLSPRTNWNSLASFEFALPPLDQQRRIADILWAADKLVVANTRFEEDAWAFLNTTIDAHISPDTPRYSNLAEYISVKHGWAFAGEHFNDAGNGPILLTPGNFTLKGELYFNERNTKFYSGEFPGDYILTAGDIVLVMTDLTPDAKLLGMPAIVGNECQLLHNQRIGKLEFGKQDMEPRFAYYLFLSDAVRQQIRRTASGSTVRHTSPSRILETKANIPDRAQQLDFIKQYDTSLEAYKTSVKAGKFIAQLASALREHLINPR